MLLGARLSISVLASVCTLLGRPLLPVKTLTLLGYYWPSFVWFYWFRNCLWKLLIVSRILPVSLYFKIINILSFAENYSLGYTLAVFVQFFCFLLHSNPDWSGISSFGDETIFPINGHLFVYTYVKCSCFQQKVAQGFWRLRFQLCITFVINYRFKWNKR